MKFPQTIVLQVVKTEWSIEASCLRHAEQSHDVEFGAAEFAARLVSMKTLVVASTRELGPHWSCTDVRLSLGRNTAPERILVRGPRDEIRAMIEALPDDEPEQSEPVEAGRLLCVECSAEHAPNEVTHGGEVIFVCPSCGGRLTVMSPNTDA